MTTYPDFQHYPTIFRTVRRVFFSFHYQRDIWRVNVVRNNWVAKENRQAAGYFDGSLWEKAQTDGKARVKRLVDDGLTNTSVTCVLIGAETYQRHWVDYEIFRSVSKGNGVFGVRIHGIKDRFGQIDSAGPNPFHYLGLGIGGDSNRMIPYVLFKAGWTVFEDAEPFPRGNAVYLKNTDKPVFENLFSIYDWVNDGGYDNFSSWVERAATAAGR